MSDIWPDELRNFDPSAASTLARALAGSFWRTRNVDARHIASILRRPGDEAAQDSNCYLSRRDMGQDLPCSFPIEKSNTALSVTFAASPLRALEVPVCDWDWDNNALRQIGTTIIHVYYPVEFVSGNVIAAKRIMDDLYLIDGIPVLPWRYVSSVQYFSPCHDGDMAYIDEFYSHYFELYLYERDNPANVISLGDMAGRFFVYQDIWPPGYERALMPGVAGHYLLQSASPRPEPRMLRVWIIPDRMEPAWPASAPDGPNPNQTIVEIELRAGVRVPDALPPIPLPQTAGMVGVRGVGVDGYGISYNGSYYIKVNTNLEYELAMRRLGLGASGEINRTIEVWVDDGAATVLFRQYNEVELTGPGVRIQFPPHERILFRWRSDEPFPPLAAARLIISSVSPAP